MTTINLKRYYPYMTENVILEVSDEIAAALSMGGRLCDSYKRQKRRNGECSLDTDPGFEADVLRQPLTPDEYIEARETTFALYDALAQLPPTHCLFSFQGEEENSSHLSGGFGGKCTPSYRDFFKLFFIAASPRSTEQQMRLRPTPSAAAISALLMPRR